MKDSNVNINCKINKTNRKFTFSWIISSISVIIFVLTLAELLYVSKYDKASIPRYLLTNKFCAYGKFLKRPDNTNNNFWKISDCLLFSDKYFVNILRTSSRISCSKAATWTLGLLFNINLNKSYKLQRKNWIYFELFSFFWWKTVVGIQIKSVRN